MEKSSFGLVRQILTSPLFLAQPTDQQVTILNQIIATGEITQQELFELINEEREQTNQQENKKQKNEEITNCGYTDWNKIVENPNNCRTLSKYMREALVSSLLNAINNKQDIIFYRSHLGDSVKNDPNFAEKPSFLTDEFKALSYDGKVNFLLGRDLTNYKDNIIIYKQWPLQQWGKNVMKYSQLTNKHLIYVQSDLWHCAWPSTFAEAMCNNLFIGYDHYPGSGFHFYGRNIDLFCVGDYSIVDEIKNVIVKTVKKPLQYFHAEVTDWLNMSNNFLLSLYSSQPYNNGKELSLVREWMRYPSIVWKNLNAGIPVRECSGKMIYLSGPSIPFQNIKTIGELNRTRIRTTGNDGAVNYIINRLRIPYTIEKLDISLLNNDKQQSDDLTIMVQRQMGVNPAGSYNLNPDIIYDGTITDPIVIVDGVNIIVPKEYL